MVEKYLKLNAVKFGLAGGIITAICIALTTLVGMAGYCVECTNLISGMYSGFGYSVSLVGVLLGVVYGFVDMAIATWLFALIYNKLK